MIKSLIGSIKLVLRVLKNMAVRPFIILYNKIRFFFSAGRIVQKIPNAAMKLPKIIKSKPEKREDYFDWGSFYIAKSLVLTIVILLIAIPLLIIFLIVPLFTSWFGVKNFYIEDSGLNSYNGKVRVYYDEKFEQMSFEGRLKDGLKIEFGEEFYENGRNKYSGNYEDDKFSGDGILYYEDGAVKYRGTFSEGRYEGIGELHTEDGKVYSGTFEKGQINGSGTVTDGDSVYYEGAFDNGDITGSGRIMYPNGVEHYNGEFKNGLPEGKLIEYYENGTLKYSGMFASGLYNGAGVLYSEDGTKLYSGDFERGMYSGSGTLFDENGSKLYVGEFEAGKYSGDGVLYLSDGSKITAAFDNGEISGTGVRTFANGMKYEGAFSNMEFNGMGKLTDAVGSYSYTGSFVDNDIDFGSMFPNEIAAVREMFEDKLTQTVSEDCFYLDNTGLGITMRCRFADSGQPAAITEICSAPLISGAVEIKSPSDISAANAISVAKVDKRLSSWAAKKYGIDATELDCYEARYENSVVYYWVSGGRLVLKTAEPADNSGNTGSAGSGDELSSGLTAEEIQAIFEEFGLDIEDFRSLGF